MLYAALTLGQSAPPPDDKLEYWTKLLKEAWHYELYNSGGHSVELNQFVIAGLFIVIGVLISRYVTSVLSMRIAKINRIDRHAAHVIQKLSFYLLVVIVTLVALPLVGIPITIFAVLGGALAIGVGFGAQNLFNNLISGLIIMLERPIRLGDIVEIDDHEARIENISNRCTRVKRTDGIDLLVPNSRFLESTVVNWTLTDDDVRVKVSVGVAYGSPVREVESILKEVADQSERVLNHPEPIVIFEDFGDNALIFDLYIWARIKGPMDLRVAQSELRFAIDERMADANITIAFPQRDVHLDTLQPLEVRMTRDES